MNEPGLRRANPDDPFEMRELADLTSRIFVDPRASDDEVAFRTARMRSQRVAVAEDRGALVATFASWDDTMSVPGGAVVDVNAVSGVMVSPTHKRRGLLSSWMREDLIQAQDRGAVASVLWASDAAIYGRFGFGPITSVTTWTLDLCHTKFVRSARGRFRALSISEAEDALPELFEWVQPRCAGTTGRDPFWWLRLLGEVDNDRRKHRWFIAHEDESGMLDGMLVYDHHDGGQDWVPDGEVVVLDLLAATDEAEEALWHYAASIDFISRVTFETSPDVPLRAWLIDPRAAKTRSTWDGVWARILDVPAALSARTYPVPGMVVIEVRDELAGGRYALEVGPSGVGWCVPTLEAPDLVLGASELASLWFGSPHGTPTLQAMHRLDRVRLPRRPERVDARRRLDAGMDLPADHGDTETLSWLSTFFSYPGRRQALTHF